MSLLFGAVTAFTAILMIIATDNAQTAPAGIIFPEL